mgnify:CR=1 FL=1
MHNNKKHLYFSGSQKKTFNLSEILIYCLKMTKWASWEKNENRTTLGPNRRFWGKHIVFFLSRYRAQAADKPDKTCSKIYLKKLTKYFICGFLRVKKCQKIDQKFINLALKCDVKVNFPNTLKCGSNIPMNLVKNSKNSCGNC